MSDAQTYSHIHTNTQDDEVDEMMKAAAGCEVQPGIIDYRK
jgi:hypothetical protein